MDLQQRITRRLKAEGGDFMSHEAAAKIATLEAEDSTTDGQNLLDAQAYTRGLHPLALPEPDLQALTAAGLNLPAETDVQRPVTPAGEPTVVVGGRYVVGENPTDARDGLEALVVQPGDVVTVHGIDADGDADVTIDSRSGRRGWVDPRHLTPVADSAAAPAVDDDLLRDVGLSFRDAIDRDEDLLDEDTVRFILALEPAQRLRAAWTAEAMGKRFALADVHLQECADRAIRAERERDEARAEVTALRQEVNSNALQALNARAELERLRAAKQLPDVGPVTRDGDKLWVNGCVYWDRFTAETWRKDGAERLALAAFVDAEADNTSSDDEASWPMQRVLGKDLFDVGLTSVGPDDLDNGQLAERLVALGWTRARGGQEDA